MEIRDPIHGFIPIPDQLVPIVKSPFFKRLQRIAQLGLAVRIFPGATHSRYNHSVGVMHVGSRCFDAILKDHLKGDDRQRLRHTFTLACMLHDIGHAPFSHATEAFMPPLSKLKIPSQFLQEEDRKNDRQAVHEDYTIKIITDSSFSENLALIENDFGVDKKEIANLITGKHPTGNYFRVDGVDYFPLLHQLVSSEVDCDRMDYLLRDSYFCGVSYGEYDLDWLINNLELVVEDNQAVLGITERSLISFHDFILSRYHMFIMVYFHYKSVCLEQIFYKYIHTSDGEYKVPSDIEEYLQHDDHMLLEMIKNSNNKYAKAIEADLLPDKIYESFNSSQRVVLEAIDDFLENEGIDYIRCSSDGRLSKYYISDTSVGRYPIKVVRKLYNGKKRYFDINKVTNLFTQFRESHRVDRIHCDTKQLNSVQLDELMELCGY